MVSVDTHILFYAFHKGSALNVPARSFLESHIGDSTFAICDIVIDELQALLGCPAFAERLPAEEPARYIIAFLYHASHWCSIGGWGPVEEAFWQWAARTEFDFRRLHEARLALLLRGAGVTEFATRFPQDYQNFGFKRVWDPLVTPSP